MGWFEKQINLREELDQQAFEDSFIRVAGIDLGKRTGIKIDDERIITKQAMDDLLKYYHLKAVDIPKNITDPDEQLDYCMRPHGILNRRIILEENWFKDAYGPILAFTKETNEPIALLPDKLFGYYFYDRHKNKKVRINKKTAELFDPNAYCFYKPLPQRKLKISDLLVYIKNCISLNDWILIIASTLIVTLVGMIMPKLSKALTGSVVSSKSISMLIGIAVCVLCTSVAAQLFSSVNQILISRLTSKTSIGVQSAMMMRLMSLPANFFQKYSAGELSSRSQSVNNLCELFIGIFVSTGLTSITSLLYITQIFMFSASLVFPSIIIILTTVIFSLISSYVQIKISKKQMEIDAKENGMSYAVISGIQKIKLSGAEKRFFTRWLNIYSDGAELVYAPPMFVRMFWTKGTLCAGGATIPAVCMIRRIKPESVKLNGNNIFSYCIHAYF